MITNVFMPPIAFAAYIVTLRETPESWPLAPSWLSGLGRVEGPVVVNCWLVESPLNLFLQLWGDEDVLAVEQGNKGWRRLARAPGWGRVTSINGNPVGESMTEESLLETFG